MGNSDVPVGQYTQKILAYYDLDEAALAAAGVITYGSNVKEVTTQIREASVDCGVIYCTDATSPPALSIVDEATAEMCGQVVYPGCRPEKQRPMPRPQKSFWPTCGRMRPADVFESVGFYEHL